MSIRKPDPTPLPPGASQPSRAGENPPAPPTSGPDRTRRLVHFAFGAAAFLVPLLGQLGSALLAGAALAYNAVVAPRFGLDRAYRRAGEGLWGGLTTYPLAVLALVLVFPAPVAAGAWIVLAVLDPVAAFVGERKPRPRVPGHARKSLAGSFAGFLAAAICLAAALRFWFAPHVPVSGAVRAAAAAAFAGAVAEAAPLPGDDNLYVAGAAGVALWWLL